MEPLSTDYLSDVAFATALEVASRGDAGEPVERRALPAHDPAIEWSPILLRQVFEQPVAVYDLLGALDIVMDRQGKLWSLDDPRHAPRGASIHTSETQAVEAVACLMGLTAKEVDLQADLVKGRDGSVVLQVKNRVPRGPHFESKFFQRKEEPAAPKAAPPDRIEALVNAETGAVYRFRRAPAPPEEPAAP